MNKTIVANFPYLKATHIRLLADAADRDESYVRKILSGDRATRSPKAKGIMKSAITLNKDLERALAKPKKNRLLVGEND